MRSVTTNEQCLALKRRVLDCITSAVALAGGDMSPLHGEPSAEAIASLMNIAEDRPLIALNLNRYRALAAYAEGEPEYGSSGREAYQRYGAVALAALAAVGGRVLWAAPAREVVIGCEHERFDEVIAVWYPSRAAFLALAQYPGYLEALERHRRAAIEHAALLFFDATARPELSVNF